MKVKIKDIAQYAGVSTGTVDRVIHGRGRVAKATKTKVIAAMEKLKYKPDILARTLARKEDPRMNILLPYPYQDFYWKMIRDGIEQALEDFSPYKLSGQTLFYDMNDTGHFEQIAQEILEASPEVILIGSEFHRQTIDLIKACNQKGIHCIVMNAEINSANCLTYIGINSYVVGELTGRIIQSTRDLSSVLVVHSTNNIDNTLHLKNKELGLIESLDKSDRNFLINHMIYNNNKIGENAISELAEKIKRLQIDTLFFTTSKAYHFAAALKNQFPELYIIGHDLIDQNIRLLRQGHIDLIIDQGGYRMGYLSIKSWVDFHILEKEIPTKQYLPLDIVYPENLPFYIGSSFNI